MQCRLHAVKEKLDHLAHGLFSNCPRDQSAQLAIVQIETQHLDAPRLALCAALGALDFVLCLLAEYTRSVLAPFTAHFVYNALSSLVFGSLSLFDEKPHLLKLTLSGSRLLSGGDMKLEGCIIMLICQSLLCVFFILRLKKRGHNMRLA